LSHDIRELIGATAPADDGPAGEARGRYREFTAFVRDDAGARYSGFGTTLEHAIDRETQSYRRSFDLDVSRGTMSSASFAESHPDVIVWEGLRAVAVLRPTPDGDFDVTRLAR